MTKLHKLILSTGKLIIPFVALVSLSFGQGEIRVNSTPTGAPFNIVSSDSSYNINSVTPYEDDNAPSELQYTVTWGTLPEYTAPASTTAFLNDGDEVDFFGIYTISTPNAPTNLIGYTVSSDQIELFWTDNSNVATAYIVQQNGFDIATVASNATTYLDTGLTPGMQYCYTVRANDSTGDSGLSNQVCLTASVPNPPSNLQGIAISDTQVDLSWQDNGNGQDTFILQRQDTTLSGFSTINTLDFNNTTYIDMGLTQNSIYMYQVLATNSFGTSAPSNLSVVTTYGPPIFDFSSNITSGFSPMPVQFTTAPFNQELGSWQWYFGDGHSSQIQNPTNTYSSGNNTTYTVTAIETNSYGDGTVIKVNYITLGLAPSNLVATATTANVFGFNLQWQDNSDNELGFQILREDGVGNGFNIIATVIADQTTYTDFGSDTTVGLNSTIAYIYRVQAFTSDTVSSPTNDAGIFPVAQFYAYPTSTFALAANSYNVTVNFTDQSQNGASWYWDFGDGVGTSNVQNPDPYVYMNISAPSIFYVTESVTDVLGASSTYTVPVYIGLAPSNVNALATSTTEILVTWTNNDNNAIGYIIQRSINNGAFTNLTTVGEGVSSYQDSGLQPVTNYGYQVQAFSSQATSDFSAPGYATTPSLAYPMSVFTASPIVGFSPLTVNFTDQSVNDEPITSPSWLWNFGDGNGSGEQNPTHIYSTSTAANYTVTFVVTNAYGSSTTVESNLIHVSPLGNFGIIPDFKFNNNSAQSNVLNLNTYTTANLKWNATGTYNIAQPSVSSTDEVSFSAPKVSTPTIDTVNFISNSNAANVSSIVKYSTYLMKKLPSVTVDSGTFIENQTIELTNYASPSPSSWPVQPTVFPLTTTDDNKVTASIDSSGNLNLSYTNLNVTKLNQPVNVIVTASPNSSGPDKDQEIVRVYEVLNQFGRFTAASDTASYGFENAPNAPNGQPTITWLSSYDGAMGVLRLTFSKTSEGIKFTPYSQYYVPTIPNNWYTVRARVLCNATTLNNTFSLSLFAYNGVPPAPTEVSGAIYFSVPTTWTWLECPIYTTGTSLYPQIIIKNLTTSLRNFYIDDIQVLQKKPDIALAYGQTRVQVPGATFSAASDTTFYAFEAPAGGVISAIALSTTGALDVAISGSAANGVKLTPIVAPGETMTSSVTMGNGAGVSCQVTGSGSLTDPFVLIAAYGTASAYSQTIDQLQAFADIFALPNSGSNYTMTAAFTSLYPYFYPQISVRATGSGHFYINDFYPQVDSDLPYYWDYSLLQELQ